MPHAALPSPAWHVLVESKQPVQPFGGTHCPAWHTLVVPMQIAHCAPFNPQADGLLPGLMHVPLGAQQPLAQLAAVHPLFPPSLPPREHTPATQDSEAEQVKHTRPFVPQADTEVPDSQTPAALQHPPQVEALQEPFPLHVHAGRAATAIPTRRSRRTMGKRFMTVTSYWQDFVQPPPGVAQPDDGGVFTHAELAPPTQQSAVVTHWYLLPPVLLQVHLPLLQ